MAIHEFSDARMSDLLDEIEPELRDAFLSMLERVRNQITPDSIIRMIEEGRYQDAIDAFDRGAELFAQDIQDHYNLSGQHASEFLSTALKTIVSFDQFSERAVGRMRESNLSLVKDFTEQQTAVVRAVIEDGIARGTNPIQMAREFRDSIGLTENQLGYVQNYRDALERVHRATSMDTDALSRELRDGRFDPSVKRAIDTGVALDAGKIDKMVDAYRDNWIQFRAETIARTEGLRALHEGVDEAFAQAIDSGDINQDGVTRTWNTAGDERVRPAHEAMQGQEVGVGEPFIDGDGNELDYPGDPDAPPETSINCRCVVSTRISITSIGGQGLAAGAAAATSNEGDGEEG